MEITKLMQHLKLNLAHLKWLNVGHWLLKNTDKCRADWVMYERSRMAYFIYHQTGMLSTIYVSILLTLWSTYFIQPLLQCTANKSLAFMSHFYLYSCSYAYGNNIFIFKSSVTKYIILCEKREEEEEETI